jgi:large subunit ribosomal protein L22
MRVSATAKFLRGSTRKARLVTRAIKGMPVEEAAATLRFMPQFAAKDIARVLQSATANAENNRSSVSVRGRRVGPSRSTSP